jgi:hypothetical protein
MRRTQASRWGLVWPFLVTLVGSVAACTPPQRIYSTTPVDRYGQSLPVSEIVRLRFEDGTDFDVPPGRGLRLSNGSFALLEPGDDKVIESWRVSQVAEVDWRNPDGEIETTPIRSPDDLRELDRIPRVYRIECSDGRVIDLRNTPRETRWSANGRALEIVEEDGQIESIPLEDIDTIVLHDSSLVKSTVGSPKFWLATGAGVAVFLWISDRADQRDNATK